MKLRIQDAVPYDRSAFFDFHDAYFERRGIQAWSAGDIPFAATSNHGLARQHAALLLAHVAALEADGRLAPDAPVVVLELGVGLGNFALHLLVTLDEELGEAGQALLKRLRYLFSDYTRINVEQASQRGPLRSWVEREVLVPCLLDMRRPRSLTDLRNKPISDQPVVVYANYVACVGPTKFLQHRQGAFADMFVQLDLDAPDNSRLPTGDALLQHLLKDPTQAGMLDKVKIEAEWRQTALADLLPEPWHAGTLTRWVDGIPEATLSYPYGFLGFMQGFRERLAPGGIFLITDYGDVEREDIAGLRNRRPRLYGNTVNHGVSFTVFPAFAAEVGLEVRTSRDAAASLHFAALGEAIPAATLDAFQAHLVDRTDGEDLLDARAAANLYVERKEWRQALRFWRRAIALDPYAARQYHQAAEAAINGRFHHVALELLLRGRDVPGAKPFDFAFELGRVYARLEDHEAAARSYREALAVQDNAVAHTNLGISLERLDDRPGAYRHYQAALKVDAGYERAKQRLDGLKATLWDEAVAGWTREA